MLLITRPATLEDCQDIGSRLRPEDDREVRTAAGVEPSSALADAIQTSRETYTFRLTNPDGSVQGRPSVIFGVIDDQRGGGIPWMVCTPDLMRFGGQRALVREGCCWIEAWLTRFPKGLYNIIDSRNPLHIRWIRMMGFRLTGTVDINGVPFHTFRQDS